MKPRSYVWFGILISGLVFLAFCGETGIQDRERISLEGEWRFELDPENRGKEERWFSRALAETVLLPGSLQEQGRGYPVSLETAWTGQIVDTSWFTDERYAPYRIPGNIKIPFWLQPERHYVGLAWYQRDVDVPEGWQNRAIVLIMERCHWETHLWVDDVFAGGRNSLAAPHVYDLTDLLSPGKHRLTICVDNRMNIDVGINAHSVSDHTQTNWNGIIGSVHLEASGPKLRILDAQVYPDIQSHSAEIRIRVENKSDRPHEAAFHLQAKLLEQSAPPHKVSHSSPGFILNPGIDDYSVLLPLGPEVRMWDEFAPHLYSLQVRLQDDSDQDIFNLQFGMRECHTDGTRLLVNSRPVFLRGTLECSIFPLTGYPSMDIEAWSRIFEQCKAHGLNHMRFHSWCPPEAAFAAADQAGIYLQVECGAWTEVGSGTSFDAWLYEESERIVRAYGNHPSFCFLAYGNEPSGENQKVFLGDFIRYWKAKDRRRLYTSAAGWPLLEESDFHSTPEPRIQHWGAGLDSLINREAPQTRFDFKDIVSRYNKPVVSHEIGQWCVYPNFAEIPKYTGVLKAKNFEIFKETLEKNHMGHLAEKFLLASGKLQALCYKADIEAALRTPDLAGFQLLDLHDFPGQGTALVGILDPFWDSKGYIKAEEFNRFCGPLVPLARMDRRTFRAGNLFQADIEAAHFGIRPLTDIKPHWEIRDPEGLVKAKGELPPRDIPLGNGISLGTIEWPLETIVKAEQLTLMVWVGSSWNSWPFWVYPETLPPLSEKEVFTISRLDEQALAVLEKGGRVFWTLDPQRLLPGRGGDIPLGFSSIFWNTAWTRGQAPHTLGIIVDPQHEALAHFPTDFHSHWQWWEIVSAAKPVILDEFPPELEPVIRVIDDWFKNRPLGLVFEARVGRGRLLVSCIDFKIEDKGDRPALIQLHYSLMRYADGPDFNPKTIVSLESLYNLSRPPF